MSSINTDDTDLLLTPKEMSTPSFGKDVILPMSSTPSVRYLGKSASQGRMQHLDAMRGVIITIMALDHVSAFTGYRVSSEYWYNPNAEILVDDWVHVMYFITRFITHLAQMGFFFLMGISMVFLYQSRLRLNMPRSNIVKHFMVRGLVLIFFTISEDIAFTLSGKMSTGVFKPRLMFCVLSALGFSMMFCSVLLVLDDYFNRTDKFLRIGKYRIGFGTLLLISVSVGIAIITNFVIHALNPADNADLNPILAYLFVMGATKFFFVLDPVLPWVTVAVIGILFGKLFSAKIRLGKEPSVYKTMSLTAVGFWVVFVVLRVLGLQGVTNFGSFRLPAHSNPTEYANAFFSLTKYPPSISFICFILGADMLLFCLIYKINFVGRFKRLSKPALVFGKSSLFFYVIHLYIYLFLGFIYQRNPDHLDVHWAYPIWVTGLVFLYPLCKAYGEFKGKTRPDSIWRLF